MANPTTVSFPALVKRFDDQGEKTGWTYIDIPAELAGTLKPGNKKSFRVKGTLNGHPIAGVALVPMGGGDFIMALNATMRKATRASVGSTLQVALEEDPKLPEISAELLACLEDEPLAKAYFNKLPRSHQLYYTRWIDSAKAEVTRTRRIAQAINAMAQKVGFGEMLRQGKEG